MCIVYVVTWMAIAPIRSVAYVAERLTAGALNERMQVSVKMT